MCLPYEVMGLRRLPPTGVHRSSLRHEAAEVLPVLLQTCGAKLARLPGTCRSRTNRAGDIPGPVAHLPDRIHPTAAA